MAVSWQPSLLDDDDAPAIDESFARCQRIELDADSWIDLAPQWVTGAARLFADLLERLDWGQRSRHMYDKVVAEPRLTSSWNEASGRPLEPPIVDRMRAVLGARYGVHFDSAGFNLYRDGRDSVAWHRDRIARHVEQPVVALVALGDRRRFLLRPRGGGASRPLLLGEGDLLITGGSTQRTWEHSVPKVARAGPRISIAFRHDLARIAYVDVG